MLLPREHLSLSCLDLSNSDSELANSRFVESHIKILDLESRLGSTPSVLIARNEGRGALYALERYDHGRYVMCKLGSWVDLGTLIERSTALALDRLRPAEATDSRQADTMGAVTTPRLHKEQKKKRAAIEAIQSLVRKKTKARPLIDGNEWPTHDAESPLLQLPSPNSTSEEAACARAFPSSTPPGGGSQKDAEGNPSTSVQQTAADIFDNIRAQYFEALYRSMVRLQTSVSCSSANLTKGLTGLLC